MYRALRLEVDQGVGVLTLNLPEKRNAMTPELTEEFSRAIGAVRQDDSIRALVIAGAGPVFCAGGDLGMLQRMVDQPPDQNRREMLRFYLKYLAVLELDIPTIAAIGGHAIGAGLAFALACDVRLAASAARLSVSFVNLGLHPGMGSTHLLPQMVGTAHAADLLLTGRTVTAAEALSMGLVSRVLPAEEVVPQALTLAREMAVKPPLTLQMAKRALVRPKVEGLQAALEYEALAQAHSYASPEIRAMLAEVKRR